MARKKTDGYGNYIGSVDDLDTMVGSLPPILGTWFFVDPYAGSDSNDGLTPGAPFLTLDKAYEACTSGAGDGIAFHAPAISGASRSLTLKKTITWAKWGITVVGLNNGCGYMGRSRITCTTITTTATLTAPEGGATITRASGSFITDGWVAGMAGICAGAHTDTFVVSEVSALTLTLVGTVTASAGGITSITSYIATMFDITGSDNRFMNLYIANEGTHALSLIGVTVHANRNRFDHCHFRAGCNATTAAVATCASLCIDTASETEFNDCWFGDNNTIRTAASGTILLTGVQGQNFFNRCKVLQWSATANCAAIRVAAADTIGGQIFFDGCMFQNWRVNKGAILSESAIYIVGASSNNKGILISGSTMYGWTSWCNVAGTAFIGNSDATASGAGGIATAS